MTITTTWILLMVFVVGDSRPSTLQQTFADREACIAALNGLKDSAENTKASVRVGAAICAPYVTLPPSDLRLKRQ